MTSISGKLQMQHLAWRAGFGEHLSVIEEWSGKRRKQIVNNVLTGSEKEKFEPLKIIDKSDLPDIPKSEMTKESKNMLRKMQVQGIKDLNISWINIMINSEHPLREKMALF